MNRYIILRDLKSIQGAKFFKNEVVIGKTNNNGVHIDVIRENGYKNNVNNLVKNKDIKKVLGGNFLRVYRMNNPN